MDEDKKRSNVVQLPNKGHDILDKFVENFRNGKIKDAIIVYLEDGEPTFTTLTSSKYSTLGWLLFQTIQGLFLEEKEKSRVDEE